MMRGPKPILGVEIAGTGSALPRRAWTNEELIDFYQIASSDEWIRENVGIEQRHICEDDETIVSLAVEAGKNALESAGIVPPATIDKLFLATTTSATYLEVPGAHPAIQRKLTEMGYEVTDSDETNTACTGFMSAYINAHRYFKSDEPERVLVIGSDTLSRITDYHDRSTGILFGDGAGAVVLQKTDRKSGILGWHHAVDGSQEGILYCEPGGKIKMDGPKVFEQAVRAMESAGKAALQHAGVEAKWVDLTIPHQANLRIIKIAAKKLGIDMSRVVVTLYKHGNTSSGSIPLGLDEAYQAGRLQRGDLLLMDGFGGGMSKGATVGVF